MRAGVKNIIANDICEEHLQILCEESPPEFRQNLTLLAGAFPHEINIPDNSIGAALIARVLHLFSIEEVEDSMKKLYSCLKPGGKVFVVCDTPYNRNLLKFIPIYERRLAAKEKWPGYIADFKQFSPDRGENLPNSMNLMDPDTLERALCDAGFLVEEKGFFAQDTFPADSRLDGREGVGVIAIKPLAT